MKQKLGTIKHFEFGSKNNPLMYACMIAVKASYPEWKTSDFETIVKEIQQEAYEAGLLANNSKGK
jgi:hypothetical protein